MSLASCLSDNMTPASMRSFAGFRAKGAKSKEDALTALLLCLGQDETAVKSLPDAAQKKLRSSPVAQRELKRIRLAAGDCKTWRQFEQVLAFFPPCVLLHVLNEEMSSAQMKTVAGKERAGKATDKDELIFGVLLALATRGPKAMRDLPANAQTRIEAAPAALEWVKMLERADTDFLAKVTTGQEFHALLRSPQGEQAEGEIDLEEEAEEESEEEEGKDATPATGAGGDARSASRVVGASSSPLVTALEAVATMMLPFVIILAIVYMDTKAMPGQPGDDTRLHRLAR